MLQRYKKLGTIQKILFAVLIGIAVVAFWRGSWGIMDVYLFPNNYEISSWASITLGLIILYATHYLTKELV